MYHLFVVNFTISFSTGSVSWFDSIGSGGDCDANSIWLSEDENKAAFIGDLIYRNNHYSAIAKQKEYFNTYCANVLTTTNGTGIFTDDTRKTFEQNMIELFPTYGCQFMVVLSADRAGKELVSLSH